MQQRTRWGHLLRASSENDVTEAFATIVQQGAGAVIVSFDAFFLSRNDQFVALAARHSLPAIYHWREFAESGGLMAYGTNLVDAYRQTGIYAGKILQGARPVDLPVLAADQVRVSHQPQDRQSARPHRATGAAYARRRGDRIDRAMSAIGTKRT
jgi:ABC-type uncharacterized transport system substrate-binding protein